MHLSKRFFSLLGILALVAGISVGAMWFASSRFNIVPNLIATSKLPPATQAFPEIDLSSASPTQQKIVELLKQEYKDQPPGTKYADGVEESWCADFVSWIMKNAERPLSNPNNGGWRIPGTYTLRDYYESTGQFRSKASGYQPKLGDAVLYDNPSPHGQHTNIVVKNDNGMITTIGGNEGNKIRIQVNRLADDPGLIGYGILE